MKSTFSILILIILTITTNAQTNALDRYFQDYQEDTSFTKISISGKMFELITKLETENDEFEQIQDFVKDIESINILASGTIENGTIQYDRAINQVSQDYEELMAIDDKDGKATFYVDETEGIIKELVIIGGDQDALALISVVGNIDLNKLAEIVQKLEGENFKELRKIGDYGANEISIYPNPARSGERISIDISEEMEGADVTIHNMSGQAVLKQSDIVNSQSISLANISTGSYILTIEKDGVAIHKKLLLK